MATYSSYKRINGSESIDSGTVTTGKIDLNALNTWDVKWFYGSPTPLSSGCCCLWTVPSNVRRLFLEAWGSGGNGHGACVDNRCHHYKGAGGGAYASVSIATAPGCQYTVCAAGVFPCCSVECVSCNGCSSWVTGFNLSNFCAIGGSAGCANTSWTEMCFSAWDCCIGPASNGSNFTMQSHPGAFMVGNSVCHCHCQGAVPTPAAFIGTTVQQHLHECWMKCGCWTVPYGHGGQGAMTTYCGVTCCGQGGTGGPGIVKITMF